jgi:two-component system chemotaxis response regulator CheB
LGSINTTHKLLAVGASTGGTVAMQTLFQDFTPEFPPTVAVIHMPERFTHTFAHRLNELCSVTVKEAEDRDIALQGCVYIAPGNKHLVIETSGANHILRVINGPRVFNQRPSVDVLFRSVADQVGGNSLGVLLTGMGRDGADGLLKMKEAGAFTITQDESSCVVYGMPKEAFELGASCIELPIEKIAGALNTRLSKKVQTKTGASYA